MEDLLSLTVSGVRQHQEAVLLKLQTLCNRTDQFLKKSDIKMRRCNQSSKKGTLIECDLLGKDTELQQKLRQIAFDLALPCTFVRVPSEYYDMPLTFRRDCLQAKSVAHLCKSIILVNTAAAHQNTDDPLNSKYYCVCVQYIARLNTEKIITLLRNLSKASRSSFNFKLVDSQKSDQLSGFEHNAVTPLGMKTKLPILLSHKIAQLDHFWLGGGEVDVKLKLKVKDFVRVFNPIVGDMTYNEEALE